MDDSAIVAAMRGGHLADAFLAFVGAADESWIAVTPDDTGCVGAARIGAMAVWLDSNGLTFHGHPDVAVAHECLVRVGQEAAATGHRMEPGYTRVNSVEDLASELTRVPDAVVEVDGKMAEAFYV